MMALKDDQCLSKEVDLAETIGSFGLDAIEFISHNDMNAHIFVFSLPMEVGCGSFGKNSVPQIDYQAQDAKVDRVGVTHGRLEPFSGRTLHVFIRLVCRERNLCGC